MRDPYEVLGLAPGATEDEIKAAYKSTGPKIQRRELRGLPS